MTRPLVVVCVLATTLAACGTVSPEAEPTPPSEAAAATKGPAADNTRPSSPEVAYLERRLELAKGDTFYLLLDEDSAQLRLMYGGALLQTYPVRDMRIGQPRAAFAAVGTSTEWHSTIWQNGTLAPARPEVETLIKPADGATEDEEAVVIPPTAEEAIPVPARYRVRFDGGLALEVRQVADPDTSWWTAFTTGWSNRWQDVWSALLPGDRDALRVRVALDASDADRLYRALPPDTKLLIAEPTADAP